MNVDLLKPFCCWNSVTLFFIFFLHCVEDVPFLHLFLTQQILMSFEGIVSQGVFFFLARLSLRSLCIVCFMICSH